MSKDKTSRWASAGGPPSGASGADERPEPKVTVTLTIPCKPLCIGTPKPWSVILVYT
jgi:hypothetical protein